MEIKEITNKTTWEKFISENSPQSLFQAWNWGREENKIKNIWRLGIFVENSLIGISQVNKITAKRGTFLHIRNGPIFTEWQKNYNDFLINYLKKIAKEVNAGFIRISPLIENSCENRKILSDIGFRDAPIHAMDGEYCWVLDINKSHEELMNGMRKTTRYLIRQAEKMDINIVKSKEPQDLDKFMRLYDETADRHHFVKHKGIKEEFRQFLKNDQILLFLGLYKKELFSGALILFYNNQAIYHHSASRPTKIPVNYLLQWEVIQEAKKRGKQVYNFFGIAAPDKPRHPWIGLSNFKKGFGGRVIEYMHAQDLPLSPVYYKTYIIEFIRKQMKGY